MMFKSAKIDAIMSKVSSVFPENSFNSGFWTTLFGLCSEDPVVELTATLTHAAATLSIAVKNYVMDSHQQHYRFLYLLCRLFLFQ